MRTRAAWLLLISGVAIVTPLALFAVSFGAAVLRSPFSWHERDWNGDGRTTISEYVYAADLGARAAKCPDGKVGTEYFRLKDGLPDKVACDRPWGHPPDQIIF